MDPHLGFYVLGLIKQLGAYEGVQDMHLELGAFLPKLVDHQEVLSY